MKRLPILLLLLLTLSAGAQYWNNLEVYRLNKVQPHDRIVPDGDRWSMSLNGTWRFRAFDNPSKATLNPSHWDTIKVPGNVELQGFGVPVYVNMKNEFPSNPPYAPTDYNPTYIYARTFEIPKHWQGRRTIIKFGAVKSAMYLYVNDREVGYSEDSKTPAEWDITRYLHEGRNRQIRRMCESVGLEVIRLRRTAVGSVKLVPAHFRQVAVGGSGGGGLQGCPLLHRGQHGLGGLVVGRKEGFVVRLVLGTDAPVPHRLVKQLIRLGLQGFGLGFLEALHLFLQLAVLLLKVLHCGLAGGVLRLQVGDGRSYGFGCRGCLQAQLQCDFLKCHVVVV